MRRPPDLRYPDGPVHASVPLHQPPQVSQLTAERCLRCARMRIRMHVHDVERIRRPGLERLLDPVERHSRRAGEGHLDGRVRALHRRMGRPQQLRVERGVRPLEEMVEVRLVPDLDYGNARAEVPDERLDECAVAAEVLRRVPGHVIPSAQTVEDRQPADVPRREVLDQPVVGREVQAAVRPTDVAHPHVAANPAYAQQLGGQQRFAEKRLGGIRRRHVCADPIRRQGNRRACRP